MVKRLVLWVSIIAALALVVVPVAFAQTAPEEPVSDEALWALVVGFFLPPALSVLMQTGWSSQLKAVIALIACGIAGAGTAYFAGELTGRSWVSAGLLVLVAAQTTYRNFWKPTGIAPAIEARTSLGGGGGG